MVRLVMPVALAVDWSAIRILAESIGVPEAARRTGIDSATLRQRAHREGWKTCAQPVTPQKEQRITVTDVSQVLADTYRDQRVRTRMNMSHAALKASETLAEQSGQSLINDGGTTLKTVAQAASLVHGWQEQTQARVTLNISALSDGVAIESVSEADITPTDEDTYDPMSDPAL